MKLLRVSRDAKKVKFTIETQGHMGVKEVTETCHEAPLQSFDDALQSLAPIAAGWAELINDSTVEMHTLALDYTKHGTRSVRLAFNRELSVTGKSYKLKAPPVQIDDPATDESTVKQASEKEAKAVQLMIDEAIRYVEGERAQRLLGMEEGDSDDDENKEDELPMDQ